MYNIYIYADIHVQQNFMNYPSYMQIISPACIYIYITCIFPKPLVYHVGGYIYIDIPTMLGYPDVVNPVNIFPCRWCPPIIDCFINPINQSDILFGTPSYGTSHLSHMGYEKNPITSCELVLEYVAIHGKMYIYILPAKDSVFFGRYLRCTITIYIYTILHTKKRCFLIYIYLHIYI